MQLKTNYMKTSTPWRTFSIFISSTFADMQAERDHLKNIVFPKVEEELRKKRIRLETVDLRWGVDTASVNEDEREATILKVCLEEIERCKPFFIGLLGDRYGWVPPEERITNATVGIKLLLPNKGKSVTALEIEFGVLASSEQLNRSVFYLREPLPYDKLSPDKAAKFSDEHDPNLSEEEKRTRKDALDNLKQVIRSHFASINLPEKVKKYTPYLNLESGAFVYSLETWGEMVYKDILTECEKHAEDTWGEAPKDQHEEEVALLDAFVEEHTHVTTTITEKGEEQVHTFCGREKLIEELRNHLLSNETNKWGIVLTGESGSGKSAAFSMMCKTMMKEGCLVLAHSAGISPASKSVAELLRKWNRQLNEFLGVANAIEQDIKEIEDQRPYPGGFQETAPKPEIEKMQERFAELLQKASEKNHVVLLIDALDQFEPTPRAQYMTWLPDSVSQNIRLLATAILGTEKNAVQYHKGFVTRSIDHFTQEEAREMLYSLGRKQHKSLPGAVEKEILEKKREDGLNACSSPLWLSLTVNILMAMDADDFEKMSGLKGKGDEQIKIYMLEMVKQFPTLPGDLFLDLIKRAARIFGESFTISLFNFIASSRGGLRESDLEILLPNQTSEAWDPLRFAGLRRWFRVHLVEQGDRHQWNLGHSIMRNTLKEKVGLNNLKNLHILTGSYLLSLPSSDALRITETMYHLLQPDDRIPAIGYYTSELDNESLACATNVLSETVTSGEEGLATIAFFPSLIEDRKDILPVLLGRFIYTLNDDLAQEGNLDRRIVILDYLNEVIERCFGSQKPTWDFGYNKAGLYEKLGSIHQAMGHMEEAFKYYEKYLELTKELNEYNPRNESLKNGLAISYSKLGGIHQSMGHMDEALKYLENFKNIMRELFEVNPRSENIKNDLAISYEKLGDIHKSMGHMEEALKYFENHKNIMLELFEDNPRSENIKNDLAISYEKLGDIHKSMGNLVEALKYFEKDLELTKELYVSNPRNESLKNGLAISYSKLGGIYQSMGHMEEALKYFVNYNQLGKELYESNPRKESLKNGLAISYSKLGDIHQSMGHMEEALKYFDEEVRLFKELYESNPRNESLKNGLAISNEKLGEIHQSMGHMEEALKYFVKDLELTKELYESNPRNESLKHGLAISYSKLGGIYQSMGRMEEALKYFVNYNQLGKELYKSNPSNESLKNSLAISYSKLGSIHKSMGHMDEALKYFENYNQLERELYESNPRNVNLLEGLGISYYKLAMICKEMSNNDKGNEYFAQWKNIISLLTENLLQVPKYKKWNNLEY